MSFKKLMWFMLSMVKESSQNALEQDKRIEIFLPGNTAKLQGK
jgi:hypothetical protein